MEQLTLGKNKMNRRIIKRKKHTEQYSRQKLQKSIYASCLSVCEFAGAAELTSQKVCEHVEGWLEHKHEVTSSDIRRIAGTALKIYSPNAAVVYETVHNIN